MPGYDFTNLKEAIAELNEQIEALEKKYTAAAAAGDLVQLEAFEDQVEDLRYEVKTLLEME